MNVFIVGIGLIGGSLVKALKEHHGVRVIGFDANKENEQWAFEMGVIDERSQDFEQSAKEADIIILATPVKQICMYLEELSCIQLKEQVIVTDVGSTKTTIMNVAESLRVKGITFIGGHPMAGSHKSGVLAAKAQLFENAYYVLSPFDDCPPAQLQLLKELLTCTKAYLVVVDAIEHDKITGMISHFPHLVAAGLVQQAQRFSGEYPLASDLAAGGFRDITRIASSNPEMWRDIVLNNQGNVVHFLTEWIKDMMQLKKVIEKRKSEEIYQFFAQAKNFRDTLPIRKSGAIPAFYDLFVDILDTSGAIAHVTKIIAEANLNIKNLGILEAREGFLGVFRISFQNEDDRIKGKRVLEEEGYETYLKL